jgi:hypothetical protein
MGSGLYWISELESKINCDFKTVVIKNLGLDWTQILDWTLNFIGVERSGSADEQVRKAG